MEICSLKTQFFFFLLDQSFWYSIVTQSMNRFVYTDIITTTSWNRYGTGKTKKLFCRKVFAELLTMKIYLQDIFLCVTENLRHDGVETCEVFLSLNPLKNFSFPIVSHSLCSFTRNLNQKHVLHVFILTLFYFLTSGILFFTFIHNKFLTWKCNDYFNLPRHPCNFSRWAWKTAFLARLSFHVLRGRWK